MQHCFHVVFYIIGTQYLHIMHLEKISPSELVSNGYISNHNFENIKRKIQRIISDSCFQLNSWLDVDARAPSIPLLNFPFKWHSDMAFAPSGGFIKGGDHANHCLACLDAAGGDYANLTQKIYL